MEEPDYKNYDLRLLLSTYEKVLNLNLQFTDEFQRMAKANLEKHKKKIAETGMEQDTDNK